MAVSREERKRAFLDKASAELEGLAERGVTAGGNAFSELLFLRGAAAGEGLFSDAERKALRASLERLGYPPECWMWLLTSDEVGTPLDASLLREAVAALDPATLVAVDDAAAEALRNAYANELAELGAIEQAMLVPGVVAHVLGMRVMALGNFAAALDDPHGKQIMWARLKLLPPLGEPY